MTDKKAPERIWAWAWEIDTSRGQWDLNPSVGFDGEAEYVRADLLTAAEAERDRLAGLLEEAKRALRRQGNAWENALDLEIIAERHRTAATVLRDEARATLAELTGGKDE